MSAAEIASAIAWPVVALVALLLLKKPLAALINRFSNTSGSEAELGPLKIKLGQIAASGEEAVKNLATINTVMAESRLLELEITSGMFGHILSSDQQARMQEHINKLKALTGPV